MFLFAVLQALATPAPVGVVASEMSVRMQGGQCALHIKGTAGRGSIDAVIWPQPGLPTITLLIRDNGSTNDRLEDGNVDVVINPKGQSFIGYSESTIYEGHTVLRASMPNSLIGALRNGQEMSILHKKGKELTLKYGNLSEEVDRLGECELDLIKSWGVDPHRLRPLILPGQTGFTDIAPFVIYPEQAKRRGAHGKAVALLAVNGLGYPESCKIIESTEDRDLDQKTCEIALHHEHYPTIQSESPDGERTWTMFTIRWQLTSGTRIPQGNK